MSASSTKTTKRADQDLRRCGLSWGLLIRTLDVVILHGITSSSGNASDELPATVGHYIDF